MTPEAQRIGIAEACGWTEVDRYIGEQRVSSGLHKGRNPKYPKGKIQDLPDYLNDLNAMHEAEKVLTDDSRDSYSRFGSYLYQLDFVTCRDRGQEVEPDEWSGHIAFATAAQRAEAFLRTLGKWKE